MSGLRRGHVAAIGYHLPDRVVTNDVLNEENPEWEMSRVEAKIGIRSRHIAGPNETASDLGFAAAEKLLTNLGTDRSTIDCLIFCTQSPDYLLPTTACVLQDRLRLPTRCAAFDFNQGCSGYVYGLAMAQSFVASGMAHRVLLITGETYSKLIHPQDRSVRVLFGDAGSATLVDGDPSGARIGASVLGTDGSGYQNLIVPAGASRRPSNQGTTAVTVDDNGSTRSAENLFMNGQELFLFTLRRVPEVVHQTLAEAHLRLDDVQWFVFHQANRFMNEHLRVKLGIPKEKARFCAEDCGNTVSSTIPIALHRTADQFKPGDRVMLVGFGVGYSWGACMLDWGMVRVV